MLRKFMSRKAIKSVIIILVIIGLGAGAYFYFTQARAASNPRNAARESTAKVMRGDLDVTITGTGTVQPISSYDIVPLVKGNIISAPFEEGMSVKAGDLLYKIDESELSYNIEKTQNSISRKILDMQEVADSIKNLTVYAPCEGRISGFSLDEGQQVGSNSKIANIIDDKHVVAVIPFNKSQVQKIKVGQKAQLLLPDYMSYIDGSVRRVSNVGKATSEGAVLYDVEIVIDNPGAIPEGLEVKGTIKSDEGDIVGVDSGVTAYPTGQPVITQSSGIVKKIYIKDGEWVKAGQKILELENDSLILNNQKNSLDLKDLQLSLDSLTKQLQDYSILSPIDGVVVKKNYKVGDTINNPGSNTVLMTVADMTKMVFTINVDELDIAKVAVGQKAEITADALPGVDFAGEVTSVSVMGTSQNGVTTYPVEVTISEPGSLKPGMNVNAKILVESKKDVLYVPVAAVIKSSGKTFVLVKDEGGGDGSSGGRRQQTLPNANRSPQIPNGSTLQGRTMREVKVGINNSDYIEIVSGLKEGETVYYTAASGNGNSSGNRQRGPMIFRMGPGGGP